MTMQVEMPSGEAFLAYVSNGRRTLCVAETGNTGADAYVVMAWDAFHRDWRILVSQHSTAIDAVRAAKLRLQ